MNKDRIESIIKRAKESRAFRKYLATKSFYLFVRIYFSKEMFAPAAAFQKEICDLAQLEKGILAVAGFRGCGKSLFLTQCYPIWVALTQGKHNIVIVGGTQSKAQAHFANLKSSLENNELLKKDFGPFMSAGAKWSEDLIVIGKYDAQISAVSVGTSVRGIKYNQYRPQIVVADDIQDGAGVLSQEARDKTFNYLQNEIIMAREVGMQLIIVGNLLHPDSTIMRLMKAMEKKDISGTYRKYPLIDQDGTCIWPQYYTPEVIASERAKVMSSIAWELEMNLKFISATGAVVKREWIHRYSKPPNGAYVTKFVIGVDPAISKRQTSDNTAIVTVIVCNSGEQTKLFVYPNSFNEHVDFPETITEITARYNTLRGSRPVDIVVEDVAYQASLPQQLQAMGLPAEGFKVPADKRAKLSVVGYLSREEKIVYAEAGCEDVINQLLDFGNGGHDDLADALALIAFKEFPDDYPKFAIPGPDRWPGAPIDVGSMTDEDIRAMLRDPARLAELEKQADLDAIAAQLKARGIILKRDPNRTPPGWPGDDRNGRHFTF